MFSGPILCPMSEMVPILEYLGATNVGTYIQSGNAVFQSATRTFLRLNNCSASSGETISLPSRMNVPERSTASRSVQKTCRTCRHFGAFD